MNIVRCPETPRGFKNARPFSVYNCIEENLLQIFFVCEYRQRQSCKAFKTLVYPCNNGLRVMSPIYYVNIWSKLTNPLAITLMISNQYLLAAPQP